jgi:hypothetical protein
MDQFGSASASLPGVRGRSGAGAERHGHVVPVEGHAGAEGAGGRSATNVPEFPQASRRSPVGRLRPRPGDAPVGRWTPPGPLLRQCLLDAAQLERTIGEQGVRQDKQLNGVAVCGADRQMLGAECGRPRRALSIWPRVRQVMAGVKVATSYRNLMRPALHVGSKPEAR